MEKEILEYIKERVDVIEQKLDNQYVRKGEFRFFITITLLVLGGLFSKVLG